MHIVKGLSLAAAGMPMKAALCRGALALLLLAAPALAQDKTQDPNKLTVQAKRPPLTLTEQQRVAIEEALETENTQQKTPKRFEPKVGDAIPPTMTVDVMPQHVVTHEPSLQPYGYAKLAKHVLVIDPMKKTIVAVLPRQTPNSGKDLKPADWANTKGRELTGQAPEPETGAGPAHEPAGDAGDKANGNEQGTQQ